MNTFKVCKECGETKKITNFYRHCGYTDRYNSRCIECHNKIRKQRYKYKVRNREDDTDVRLMTHGEAYVFKKENINFKDDIETIKKTISYLPPKMSREETIEYYSNKIRNYFHTSKARDTNAG